MGLFFLGRLIIFVWCVSLQKWWRVQEFLSAITLPKGLLFFGDVYYDFLAPYRLMCGFIIFLGSF